MSGEGPSDDWWRGFACGAGLVVLVWVATILVSSAADAFR